LISPGGPRAPAAQATQADQIKGAENLYHEALRPQFHFSSRRGWNNDPDQSENLSGCTPPDMPGHR
jgi:sucrose-6-phosphate hydrolase SacC (GH32 family)